MAANQLWIGPDLFLPVEAVTQAIGVLAKRRAGKSYFARRFAEQLHHAGQQIVVVDPKGDWWGIRAAADGKHAGLPILILGGERGDVPLEVRAGEMVARMVVEERVSVLLDLSHFRKREVSTFMADFLETLYRTKAREAFRTPVMVIIDEADAIAPQQPKNLGIQGGDTERMLGACEDLVRRGGQRGLGCMMITQRAAVLNKNVLTQIGILVALQVIAPQDLKAVKDWVDVHGTPEQKADLLDQLPSLQLGKAFVWAPGWPSLGGIFALATVGAIETFDSGATPRPGQKRVEPKLLAAVDLDALRRQMAETVERAKANDPKLLHARIRELEAQLAKPVPSAPVDAAIEEARRQERQRIGSEVEVFEAEVRARLDATAKLLQSLGADASQIETTLRSAAEELRAPIVLAIGGIPRNVRPVQGLAPPEPQRVVVLPPKRAPKPVPASTTAVGVVSERWLRILDALAWLEGVGVPRPHVRPQVALLCRYAAVSGGFKEPVKELVEAGLVEIPAPTQLALTEAGRVACSGVPAPLSAAEIQQRVLEHLDPPCQRALRAVLAVYPAEIARADLASQLGYAAVSGGFKAPLKKLFTLRAVAWPRPGFVRAAPWLFKETA